MPLRLIQGDSGGDGDTDDDEDTHREQGVEADVAGPGLDPGPQEEGRGQPRGAEARQNPAQVVAGGARRGE